jgi:polysaccharide biosynthesis/export protein
LYYESVGSEEKVKRVIPWLVALSGLVALASLFVGCCGPNVTYDYNAEAARTGAYRVGPGDVLRISVWGNNQLSGNVTVRPDGQITLQLIGEVQAAGRTPMEIQQDVARGLVRFLKGESNVTVTVAEVNSYRVYVVGRVNQPGEFTPDSPVTVLQALALARGMNEFADSNHIVVVRRDEAGTRRIPFVHDQAVKCGAVEMDITLITGDTVVVP